MCSYGVGIVRAAALEATEAVSAVHRVIAHGRHATTWKMEARSVRPEGG